MDMDKKVSKTKVMLFYVNKSDYNMISVNNKRNKVVKIDDGERIKWFAFGIFNIL